MQSEQERRYYLQARIEELEDYNFNLKYELDRRRKNNYHCYVCCAIFCLGWLVFVAWF